MRLRNLDMIGTILRKISENFISSFLLAKKTSKPDKNYAIKHIESDYPWQRYQEI